MLAKLNVQRQGARIPLIVSSWEKAIQVMPEIKRGLFSSSMQRMSMQEFDVFVPSAPFLTPCLNRVGCVS